MSIVVNLTPAEEARLFRVATDSGIAPEELVRKLVSEHLPAANPVDEMRRRIREWQIQDRTPALPPASANPGLTPTGALFQKWAEEDAQRTDQEIEADDRLWSDYRGSFKSPKMRCILARIVTLITVDNNYRRYCSGSRRVLQLPLR